MLHRSWASMTCGLKDLVEGLLEVKAPGPPLSFSVFHLFYALEMLSEKTVGRNRLAEHLNVGEGAIRTIVRRFVEADLMTTSQMGCCLSVKGLNLWRGFESVFPLRAEFLQTELTPCEHNYAFLVRGCSCSVGSGIEQRDAAVMAGAIRALIIVFRNGRLRIESVSEDIGDVFPDAASQILQELNPQDNDIIVVAGGDTSLNAKRGAFAASWSLLDGIG
ncbi:MAG: DUF4443 domain-containing protein [Candidatus Bathyarchaeota archaeon]|nr:DUF4443 domain-containing protein [Candidatus Bathyarchaeota archaeon]